MATPDRFSISRDILHFEFMGWRAYRKSHTAGAAAQQTAPQYQTVWLHAQM
ncbi:hypothetical protein HMPREF9248_0982 [Fannyhessea vaginae PB189-T1-4]|uniref:Uncharacterized protein n=1 Tax=Fannyhessea vaginae PB189-T1-4 TaxID=866774 RepID=A0ABN0B094_9ACTN|nr:hypothetical protein HMPREF9248_0982 [Fannyhessea vaginae PB189-T1-4]